MVKPAHAEIEAAHVMGFSGNRNGLLHGCDSLRVAAKVGLENGKIEKGILIESSITALHGVVKVAM